MSELTQDHNLKKRGSEIRIGALRELVISMAKSALSNPDVSKEKLEVIGHQCRQVGALREAGEVFERVSRLDPGATEVAMLRDLFAGKPNDEAGFNAGPASFFQIRNFLNVDLRDRLINQAIRDLQQFRDAKVFAPTGQAVLSAESRRGTVLGKNEMGPYKDLFLPELKRALQKKMILARLDVKPFLNVRYEVQVTNYSDGEFYNKHTDNASDETKNRRVSFVYYMRRAPTSFTGGDLILYDWRSRSERIPSKSHTRVLPLDNSIIFFESSGLHEVTPTSVASGDRRDGRFSINGWVVEEK